MFPRKIVSLLCLFCLWQTTLAPTTAQSRLPDLRFGISPNSHCESGGNDLLFNGALSVVVDGVIQDRTLLHLQIELAPVEATNATRRFQINYRHDSLRTAPSVQWHEIGEIRKLVIKGVPAHLLCAEADASVSGYADVELTFIPGGPGRLVISPHKEAGSQTLLAGEQRVCYATPLAGQRFYYVLQ